TGPPPRRCSPLDSSHPKMENFTKKPYRSCSSLEPLSAQQPRGGVDKEKSMKAEVKKRLTLSRETLRKLNDRSLTHLAAAGTLYCTTPTKGQGDDCSGCETCKPCYQ